MKTIEDLLCFISLNPINDNTFQGKNMFVGTSHIFGGQFIAQGVNAASQTVHSDAVLHSFHSYFLKAGDLNLPVEYKTQIIKQGNSFSLCGVTAFQKETPVFMLNASFQKQEEGFDFQTSIKTDVKQPEELLSWDDIYKQYGSFLPLWFKEFLSIERAIDFKPVQLNNPLEKKDLPPYSDVWFKPKVKVDDISLAYKQQVLTYVSDYNFLMTTLNPHGAKANFGNMQMASLDHSIWFHRDFDINQWMLFSVEVENTSGARGLVKGKIYTRSGMLIATVLQEGLMRYYKKE